MLGYVDGGSQVKRAEVQRVENGWVVNIYNPTIPGQDTANAMSTILPTLRAFRKEMDSSLEPWKAEAEDAPAAPAEVIPVVAKEKKPMTTHVFLDKIKMLEFVSAEMA
jgi:hypothetical protein